MEATILGLGFGVWCFGFLHIVLIMENQTQNLEIQAGIT